MAVDNVDHVGTTTAAEWRAGGGYNLLIMIVFRHALHRAAADYYRQENISVLYFTIRVDNFVG